MDLMQIILKIMFECVLALHEYFFHKFYLSFPVEKFSADFSFFLKKVLKNKFSF